MSEPDFDFRAVRNGDFAFCWPLYQEVMQPLMVAPGSWNEAAQQKTITQVLSGSGTSILVVESSDAGWLSVDETRFIIHLSHFYLSADWRGRGLGSAFLRWMSDRAKRKQKQFTLDVLKSNDRARQLYERLGFQVIGTTGPRLNLRMAD
ncbi:MAG TPA: GNAT family N-acetyltransferase [Reyranella sp.]|nr:GNAT family N-acetyltransferase [Reyranella sp.]